MKVSIIGGGGLVGSSAAFALQCGGVVSQIDLIDLNADQVRGQALDLLHGASPEPQPADGQAAESAPSDVRPRADGLRGLDITCGSCGEDYGTNVTDEHEIECVTCEARRCPHCHAWYGGTP